MLAPTTGCKLTNHHKTFLSIQCIILCNCCSAVPVAYQCLTTLFSAGVALGCFSYVKPKRSIVPDLPRPYQGTNATHRCYTHLIYVMVIINIFTAAIVQTAHKYCSLFRFTRVMSHM